MKKIIKYLLISLPLATMIVVACGDDFLDTPVQGAISVDVLSASQSGVDASLIAAYKMLNGFTNTIGATWGSAPSNYYFESASDDTHKGSELSDNPDGYDEISIYQWSTGLKAFADKFKVTYEGVKRANNAINIANDFKKKGGTDAFVSRITGEALFLRAWYHFEAYKIFKNVPYYVETDVDFQKPNDQPVLPLIVTDLRKAITLLPETRAQVGRSDKIVAKAFLGKVLLFNKDFAAAKTEFNEVVASGRFGLVDCYNDNFTIAGDNNKESLFSHQASVNDGDGNGTNTNHLERLAAPHSGSHTDCCGFNNPSQDLVNAYQVDANGLPVANPNAKRVNVNKDIPVDPRLDWSVGRAGVPYLDWGLATVGWIRGAGWAGLHNPKKNMKLTTDAAGPGWTTNQLHAKNVEFIRYSDVLLMLAETEVETNGDLERARTLVNQIRKRAGNCAQGPVGGPLAIPITDARITWATYKVGEYTESWAGKQALAREAVRTERRLELAIEGHRLFDLRRWGILESRVTAYRAYELTVTNIVNNKEVKIQDLDRAAPVQARHYAFPIPSTEIDLSAGKLKQNEGF